MDIEKIKEIGLCIICGIKPSKKDGLTEKGMCKPCDHLADEKFYEIPSKFLVRKYFKDYLGKNPSRDEIEDINKLYEERPTEEWIHGVMPSKCPFCRNLATNRGQIQSFRRGSEAYEKVVLNGTVPKLVCKTCGDLTLYLNHSYRFSTKDSVKILEIIRDMKDDNKEKKKLVCETCAVECGFGEPQYEEKDQEFVKMTGRKVLCPGCIARLKNAKKMAKVTIKADVARVGEDRTVFAHKHEGEKDPLDEVFVDKHEVEKK